MVQQDEQDHLVGNHSFSAENCLQTPLCLQPLSDFSEEGVRRRLEDIKRCASKLPKRARPTIPHFAASVDVRDKVRGWQQFINSFEYDFTGRKRVERRKDGGLISICREAIDIIRVALPIQCVEAVFLAAQLTAGTEEVSQSVRVPTSPRSVLGHDMFTVKLRRLPLSFRTTIEGQVFRHIVLAIEHQGRWGAMGLSRRPDLMDKDLAFSSLSELVKDYLDCYKKVWHRLQTVYIGTPLAHDTLSATPIKWRCLTLDVKEHEWSRSACIIDKYVKNLPALIQFHHRTARWPENLAELLGEKGEPRFRIASSTHKRRASSRPRLSVSTVPPCEAKPEEATCRQGCGDGAAAAVDVDEEVEEEASVKGELDECDMVVCPEEPRQRPETISDKQQQQQQQAAERWDHRRPRKKTPPQPLLSV